MRKELEEFIKEYFDGNNEIRFTISESGNQRIEIEDLDDKEIWQTLESVGIVEDMSNFDDISGAILSAIVQQIDDDLK